MSRELAIEPRGPLNADVALPGSKSVSNRAVLVAALADGESRLTHLLESDDIRVMREAVLALGAQVAALGGDTWRIGGTDGRLATPRAPLWTEASGTAARFVTALACLAPGPSVVDGTARLRERPLGDLADALRQLGARIETRGEGGCLPAHVGGGGLAGGVAEVDARRSSQTVSALLLAAPYAARDVELRLVEGGLVSRPYVDVTLDVMHAFGADAAWDGATTLRVRAGRGYAGREFAVEPDASTAAYFFCAAAILGGRVRVPGLGSASTQADVGLVDVLERMGCRVTRSRDAIELHGPPEGGLHGVDVDMNAMPDAVVALAVVAAFAKGPTRVRNVAHLRIKESNRLDALETELRKLGCDARVTDDGLLIEPGELRGATLETWDDHRIAMALALAGLRVPGVVIRDPEVVSKSWPKYFEALAGL